MAIVWKQVLTSGSPAPVSDITASNLPDATNDERLVLVDSTGKFYTSSKVYYTSSDGGQLYLNGVGLTANNITASSLPNQLYDQANVVFINNNGGLQYTSSLRYVQSNNALFFAGVISGSFTGDGSGLTGVIGNTEFPIANSLGIASSSGGNFAWSGSQRVDMVVLTQSLGGIDVLSDGIRLAPSLAGDGLEWVTNYNELQISLSGSNSGLKLDSEGLAIDPSIVDSSAGALSFDASTGEIDIEVATNGGIIKVSGDQGLGLDTSLAGNGLKWETEYSVLAVDPTQFVTASEVIEIRTGSSNITLTADATPSGDVTNVNSGFKIPLGSEPVFTFDLNTTLTGDFTFEDNVKIEGDFTVSGSFVSVSLSTENLNVADQFVLLNSGSTNGQGGFQVQTSINGGAWMFFDDEANRWGVTQQNVALSSTAVNVTASFAAAITTTRLTTDNETTIIGSTPMFGVLDSNQIGQIVVTSNPGTNESPIFIYA
jgi:hypothetical protein